MTTPRVADDLKRIPIFERLGGADLKKLGTIVQRQSLADNTVVFFEGDRGDALYLISTGSVKVYKTADDGKEMIVGTLGVGDFFGELALLDGKPRSAAIATLEPTELVLVRQQDFHKLVRDSPEILWHVTEALCQRVRELCDDAMHLAFEGAPFRIIKAIAGLQSKRPADETFKLPPERVCEAAGTNLATTRRVLTMLQDRGLVIWDGEQVEVPDAAALERALEYAREWM